MELDDALLTLEEDDQWAMPGAEVSDSSDDDQLLDIGQEEGQEDAELREGGNCLVRYYARFLARFPYIIPVLVVLVASACGVLSYKYHPMPDFGKEPELGISTRGTPIRKATATGLILLYHLQEKDVLFLVPNITLLLEQWDIDPDSLNLPMTSSRKRRDTSKTGGATAGGVVVGSVTSKPLACSQRTLDPAHILDSIKFAYTSSDGDLFTWKNMRDLCKLEAEHLVPELNMTCPLISLPYRIALLNDKESCDLLTEEDFNSAKRTLDDCALFFLNGSLNSEKIAPTDVPGQCLKGGYVYSILHFLTDSDFFTQAETTKENHLKHCITYWDKPREQNFDGLHFYQHHIEDRLVKEGEVRLIGLEIVGDAGKPPVKFQLFAKYVITDLKYFAIAGGIILVIMLFYIQSPVIILATVINIGFSFTITYFVYFFVLGMKYYPFINLLAGLILVAIGADDVFVFYDCWAQHKREKGASNLLIVINGSLRHASLAIFVTSLTTASAFFSNLVSTVTCTKCFAIFAGLSVLVNFLLMVTWTPSVIVLCELSSQKCSGMLKRFQKPDFFGNINQKMGDVSSFIFVKMFPKMIEKAWFVWIPLLFALGVSSSVVVFVTPRLKLPDSGDLQVFRSSNPFEYWELVIKNQITGLQDSDSLNEMHLHFVWGFIAEDRGDKLNPYDVPKDFKYDADYNFYSKESQVWLDRMCHRLLNASFVDQNYVAGKECFFDAYAKMARQYCYFADEGPIRDSCCQEFNVPYNTTHLQLCFPLVTWYYASHVENHSTPLGDSSIIGNPVFDSNNSLVGLDIHLMANYKKSFAYEVMKARYHAIDHFMTEQLKTAPKGLRSGFFHSFTKFALYDLQGALAEGTYYSIGVSLAVAFTLMLITSRNILVSIYAIITITLAISCTVASLVLLRWRLSVIESLTVSLAVGLSIDFTIHYGVAYRLSNEYDAKSRVNEAFMRVGGAVAMAALTTFIAGAAVMPSSVLIYVKLGTFLMFCMAISWTYATFFFMSLCRIAGPKGSFCQVSLNCPKRSVTTSKYSIVVENPLEALDPSTVS